MKKSSKTSQKKEYWSKTLSFPIGTIAQIESIRALVNKSTGRALSGMQDTIIYCVNRVYGDEGLLKKEDE